MSKIMNTMIKVNTCIAKAARKQSQNWTSRHEYHLKFSHLKVISESGFAHFIHLVFEFFFDFIVQLLVLISLLAGGRGTNARLVGQAHLTLSTCTFMDTNGAYVSVRVGFFFCVYFKCANRNNTLISFIYWGNFDKISNSFLSQLFNS